MTSNLRQTRTAASTEANLTSADSGRTSKTFMDRWVEPALPPPAPSFTDYPHLHIERHGVLENMAPLGTMPSTKMKKGTRSETAKPVLVLKNKRTSAASTPAPRDVSTPEPVANHSRRRSESRKIEDPEWNPQTPIAQTSGRKSASRHSNAAGPSLVSQASPSMSVSPSKEERHLLRVDRIIESAVESALASHRVCTAYALRTLYNDHRSNGRMVTLIENIFTERADQAQQDEFQSLMTYKKKEGSKNGKAVQYFEQHDNAYTPSDLFKTSFTFSPTKRAAPDGSNQASRSPLKDGGHVSKRHKGNHSHREHTPGVNGSARLRNGNLSRIRSKSVSSTSSLSSLDEEILQDNFAPSAHQDQAHASAAEHPARNHRGPITQHKAGHPKLHSFPTTTTPALSTNNAAANTTMPAYHSETSTPQPPDSQPSNNKSHKKAANPDTPQQQDLGETELDRLRKRAKHVTDHEASVQDSYVRSSSLGHDLGSESEGPNFIALASQPIRSSQVPHLRSSRRLNDESDELSSPTRLSFQPDVGPGSTLNSRAVTPNARPSRKAKTGGPRMKSSPMKKGSSTSAGIPRASGERNSPVGNGTQGQGHLYDDNDDYCSGCGGNGDLICCDGCTGSYHLKCVDPPMVEGQLPDEWFCNLCTFKRAGSVNERSSLLASLFQNLDKKNPSAFHLPKTVREYFENVRTGTEGEYEEGVVPKSKSRGGNDDNSDNLRLRDGKGNWVLCHNCNKGPHSGPGPSRPVITCSFCSLHWHLDCIDPPLANPPAPGRQWRCPCHVDDLLAKVPQLLAPAHRFRRIKGASVIKPALSRGIKNNGYIEVELNESEDEDEGFFEQKEYGHTYKLPENGIVLDFVSKVQREKGRLAYPLGPAPLVKDSARMRNLTAIGRNSLVAVDPSSVREQQAALNLAYLRSQVTDSQTDAQAQSLAHALILEAPPNAIHLMSLGDVSSINTDRPITKADRQTLLAIMELCKKGVEKYDEQEAEEARREKRMHKLHEELDVDMTL